MGWLLSRRSDWELAITVFGEPHVAGHLLWHAVTDGHPAQPFADEATVARLHRAYRAVDASLGRLGVDHVDLYQIHRPDILTHPADLAATLDAMVESGKVRAVGVSNYNAERLRRAHRELAHRGVSLATNQVEFSLLQRKPEHTGLVDACRELGVTLIAYSPLAQGLLTGKYGPQARPGGARWLSSRSRMDRVPAVVARNQPQEAR